MKKTLLALLLVIAKQKDMEITSDSGHWNIPDVQVVNSQNDSNLVIDKLGLLFRAKCLGNRECKKGKVPAW